MTSSPGLFLAERGDVMRCPLHLLPVLHSEGGHCLACERAGLQVVTCELDNLYEVLMAYFKQGYEIDYRQSHAVIVVDKDGENRATEGV